MLTRSIGKVIRGKATPLQLALACILGSMLGFIPGYKDGAAFLHAPGLILSLVVFLIILNANLTLAVLMGVVSKLLGLALLPVAYNVGVFLLEGPTQPLFKAAINAPVLALFGFEYYATVGGLAMGLVFGIIAAVLIIGLVNGFRRKMSKLEEGSEAYQKYSSKGWVKILAWLFVGGGKGKKTYAELLERRVGNPIRPIGVVFAVLLAGLVTVVWMFFSQDIITAQFKSSAEAANGATVDVKAVNLDLKSSKLTVTELAMADSQNLDTDLFRAKSLVADVSGRDLLRKRMTLDKVTTVDASTGEKRAIKGRLVGSRPKPTPVPKQPNEKTIDDYIKEAQQWKDRLAQVRRWMDEINKKKEPRQAGKPEPGGAGQPQETLRQRLARQAKEQGYARVAASHLVEGAPTLLVKQLAIDGLKTQPLPGKTAPDILDVRGENLSTQPWLVKESPSIKVTSRSNTLNFDAVLTGLAATAGESRVSLAYRGLPADLIGRQLKVEGAQPLKGGTMDVSAQGSLTADSRINLPLQVTIRDTTMTLPQAGSAPIKELTVPIGVSGALDDPKIDFDSKAFADALAKAGAQQLADKARGEAQKQMEKAVDKLGGEAAKKLDDKLGGAVKDGLGGLLGGKKDKK